MTKDKLVKYVALRAAALGYAGGIATVLVVWWLG
jgi:hypothetical protein